MMFNNIVSLAISTSGNSSCCSKLQIMCLLLEMHIDHVDMFQCWPQGRILKHAGDLPAAAALADEARSMDLADRYLNSECVTHMLQADQVWLYTGNGI